jgi:hypothetical protein
LGYSPFTTKAIGKNPLDFYPVIGCYSKKLGLFILLVDKNFIDFYRIIKKMHSRTAILVAIS